MSREILVSIGAGVGITPFLSLMGTIIQKFEDGELSRTSPLKQAHFYWITRSVDELLFGRHLFAKIAGSPHLQHKLFLHLHTTAREPECLGCAYLFRQAVKMQSTVDRAAFEEAFAHNDSDLFASPHLPWCWASGVQSDVLWLSDLTDAHSNHQHNLQRAGSLLSKASHGTPKWAAELCSDNTPTASPTPDSANDADMNTVDQDHPCRENVLLPVTFGRPDFEKELRAIGQHTPNHDVHTYICGNDQIVKSLQNVCNVLEAESRCQTEDKNRMSYQRFLVTYERFG
jgi:ferredoxin-NADP reductase